jgi:crotonobetainyl-CoA:carnitine CoA-transferase CaiB-like acyl-CoA transferase
VTGPLTGVRVLDFASALAAPWAAGILADQGADVIKIERPTKGDLARTSGTCHNGVSAMFHLANRGKRSIVLDLRQEEGRSIAVELARTADVVVQNFRPGVAERLGVGYEQLRAHNEQLIFVAVTGFGPTGPYGDRAAFDSVIQAASGMCDSQSQPGEPPRFIEQTIADKVASMAAAQAVVAALFARERGRGGQRIDVPMLDVSVAFTWMDVAGKETLLDAPESLSSKVTQGRQCLRFADGWGVVSISSDEDFVGACASIGIDHDRFPRLASRQGRANNRDDFQLFMIELDAAAGRITVQEVSDRLLEHGVPFATINPIDKVHEDPQVVHAQLFEEFVHPVAGRIRQPRSPVRFSGTPAEVSSTSPDLGEHTDEVLAALGRSDGVELRGLGVVA